MEPLFPDTPTAQLEHLQDYIATAQAVQQEQQERLQIEMSDEYKALEQTFRAIR